MIKIEPKKIKILVTGANGFVGSAIVRDLDQRGFNVFGVKRLGVVANPRGHVQFLQISDINGKTDWSNLLKGIDVIIHCAAHLDEKMGKGHDNLDQCRTINVDGTRRLAEQAARAGVKRFVFISSLKVMGEENRFDIEPSGFSASHENCGRKLPKRGFKVTDCVSPTTPYATSKWEAELALREIEAKGQLEVVIIRPPIIYGRNPRGNLLRLIRLISLWVPLPLKSVRNKRSLLSLDNLGPFLVSCIEHEHASGQTFFVSDGEAVSTPELCQYIATELGVALRLFPCPIWILKILAKPLGKAAEINRLVGSLTIDCDHAHKILGWTPNISTKEGIKRILLKS